MNALMSFFLWSGIDICCGSINSNRSIRLYHALCISAGFSSFTVSFPIHRLLVEFSLRYELPRTVMCCVFNVPPTAKVI